MTDQHKQEEITSLMTFLQRFIENHVNQSFTDLSFDLETLVKDFLNVFEKENEKYENINKIHQNYPAIDLVNKSKSIGLQVTTNADSKKIKKTINTYKKHKIQYTTLRIIGFVKASKPKKLNAEVYGIGYLIDLAKHANNKQKDEIIDILKRKIPMNSLNPLADRLCFDIVFDVINRSAVRDYTICEGDLNNMVMGLSEIKEIITTGTIKNKSIRAKALVEYSDAIKSKLSEIEYYVSGIIQICNLNKNTNNSDFICLTREEATQIDDFKEKIIFRTNKLAEEFNLSKKIIGSKLE